MTLFHVRIAIWCDRNDTWPNLCALTPVLSLLELQAMPAWSQERGHSRHFAEIIIDKGKCGGRVVARPYDFLYLHVITACV
jgi:hypothetical protein